MINLEQFFSSPATPAQKQYELIRTMVVDKLSVKQAAEKFQYTVNTVYSLMRDVRAGKIDLFPQQRHKGPKERHTPSYIRDLVLQYRKQNLSCSQIANRLTSEGYKISEGTIENIIADHHLPRLKKRRQCERGFTHDNELLSSRATPLEWDKLEPFTWDCPVVGVFFFLPYIIESGICDLLKTCQLPASSALSEVHACLSMLLLKLIGSERLSHIDTYNHEPGLGLFAGLNVLPNPSLIFFVYKAVKINDFHLDQKCNSLIKNTIHF